MKSFFKKIKFVFSFSVLLVFVFGFLSVSSFAFVETTKEPTGSENTVYVAGNPDFYPIEYYDSREKAYCGIVPEILRLVSEDTGINFSYVSAGNLNVQNRLAKNKQVEMLSAYEPNSRTSKYLSDSVLVLEIKLENETREVYLAFTEIAPQELVASVSESIEKLSEEQLSDLVIGFTLGKEIPRNGTLIVGLLTAAFAVLLVVFVFVVRSMKKKLKKLRDDGLTDKTTNIGNRDYFIQYYNSFLNDINRGLYYVAYIAFDIRHATQYLGEGEAEQTVVSTANTLMNYTGDADIAAHLSGGSFALAFQCGNEELAKDHIIQLLDMLNRNAIDEKTKFRAGLFFIGSGNFNCETAVSNAELGYKRAVSSNESLVFCSEKVINSILTEMQILERTSEAVKNGEFRPYLQLVVNSETMRITGAEMLSRWQNPKTGLLMPGRYIEIMEQAGTIADLDFYIFEHACRCLEKWSETEISNLYLSCNFSRVTISREDFCPRLFEIAQKYRFKRNSLVLEITEDIVETDKSIALRNAKTSKRFGFRIALDDFGSGYTSFMNLCDYPIDIIKVDRSVVINSVLMERGGIMIDAIVSMAHKMNMEVVCEGVETEEQDSMVKKVGADYIQGYKYSRVIPLEELESFLERYNKKLK